MPWCLEISTIDVGQGDSSLIIASNNDSDPPKVKSMLIDGGLAGYGGTVTQYVVTQLLSVGGRKLDHILVSHYDLDHVGGVKSMLHSDNLSAIVSCISRAALAGWDAAKNVSDAKRTAAAGASAAAAAWGAYDTKGNKAASFAVRAGAAGARLQVSDGNLRKAANAGAMLGAKRTKNETRTNEKLIRTARSCVTAATEAGVSAYVQRNAQPGRRKAETEDAVWQSIRRAVARSFPTGGVYRSAQVIDPGDGDGLGLPDCWGRFVKGAVPMWGDGIIQAPGLSRRRMKVTPDMLGQEILWGSGPSPKPAPVDAPAVFLVTGQGYVWGSQTGVPPINSGQRQNDVALGVVVRFGNFFYFTAGDLPSQGEEMIADQLLSVGLPNPQGGKAFDPATRIAAFKTGHHGSDGSSSDKYLKKINAAVAFISCGRNTFGKDSDPHPTQNVINRLQTRVPRSFLTNCKYVTANVPASDGQDQLASPTNRFLVCGDNADNNLEARRPRGNARLHLTQAEATGAGKKFHVEYWDNDDLPGGGDQLVGLRVEDHEF